MSDYDSPQIVNLILMFGICLLIGGIGGYLVADRQHRGVAMPVSGFPGAATANVSDVLSLENAWIVEGLFCPDPGCTNSLRDCNDATARQIRAWVNAQLAAGRSGGEITAEIIRRHGKAVFKLGEELQR